MINPKLLERAKKFLKYYKAEENYDQVFLIDDAVIEKLIKTASINKSDRVLEIGTGLGFITKKIAEKADHVITVEIDQRLRPYLSNFPRNILFVFNDIHDILKDNVFLRRTKPPKKAISNIPYRQMQGILVAFTKTNWYKGDFVLVAPASIVDKINNEPVLRKYYQSKLIEKIEPESFYPVPNTIPAIIYIKRIKS